MQIGFLSFLELSNPTFLIKKYRVSELYNLLNLKILPETQGPELQGRVLNISPMQLAPPFSGLGSEHCLRLNCIPEPQVTLQGVQDELQSDQPPSTKV